jgi:hypothetical protein
MINDLVRTAVPYITLELPFLSLTRYCSFPCMPLLEYRENSSVRCAFARIYSPSSLHTRVRDVGRIEELVDV